MASSRQKHYSSLLLKKFENDKKLFEIVQKICLFESPVTVNDYGQCNVMNLTIANSHMGRGRCFSPTSAPCDFATNLSEMTSAGIKLAINYANYSPDSGLKDNSVS